MSDYRNSLIREPMIGAATSTKDYHCEPESITPAVFDELKPGIAVSIDGGKITAFNGSSYHAIVTNDVRKYGAGDNKDDVSISVSKKGTRVVITDTDMVKGDLMLLKTDGTFTKGGATDSVKAIGKADGKSWDTTDIKGTAVKAVEMEFNWDFIKDISSTVMLTSGSENKNVEPNKPLQNKPNKPLQPMTN